MEYLKNLSFSNDCIGIITTISCDITGNTFVANNKGIIYKLKKDDKFIKIRDLNISSIDNNKDTINVYNICFDNKHRCYISSDLLGIQVFDKINENKGKLIGNISDWDGPINLSHPSTTLIGIDYSESNIGELFLLGWKQDSEFAKKSLNAWNEEYPGWFSSIKDRNSVYLLRRSWYPDRIMYYFIDNNSFCEPSDGIKSLHMMYKPGTRNINHCIHTYMSCPWDDNIPFSLEIPHGKIPGEIILFTPKTIYSHKKIPILSLNTNENEYSSETKVFSASDNDGGSNRKLYVFGWNYNNMNYIHIIKATDNNNWKES